MKQLITIETVPISIRYSGAQPQSQSAGGKPALPEEKTQAPPKVKPKMDVYEKSDSALSSDNTYTTTKDYEAKAFELEIVQMPKVVVKYVGGPMYIPRSADPDYDETEE